MRTDWIPDDSRMPRYEKTPGGYYRCHDGKKTYFEVEQVGLLLDIEWDIDKGLMVKHGPAEVVRDYHAKLYGAAPELFQTLLVVVLPPDYPVDEINHMLACTGYIPKDIKEALNPTVPPEQVEPPPALSEPAQVQGKWDWVDEL